MSLTLVSLISAYGLLAVLVLMAAESCGLPFPSEVIMPPPARWRSPGT